MSSGLHKDSIDSAEERHRLRTFCSRFILVINGWSYGSICTALSHIFMLALVIYCRYRMAAIDLLCVVVSLIRILIGCQSLEMGKGQATGKCAELGLGYI